MSQLVATGGALVGNLIAPGIGGAIGWIVGSLVGNLLFPPENQTVQGPRLGDLSVTSSAYGAIRGRGFGTMRQAGNMIWSTGLIEDQQKEDQGGKGGMGGAEVTQVTYKYFSSFAIAFGEGGLPLWLFANALKLSKTVTSSLIKSSLPNLATSSSRFNSSFL